MKRGASLLCKEIVSSSDDLAGWSTVKPGPMRGGPALLTQLVTLCPTVLGSFAQRHACLHLDLRCVHFYSYV